MLFLRLILCAFFLFYNVIGEGNAQEKPDITLLANSTTLTCVASGNTADSALVFNGPKNEYEVACVSTYNKQTYECAFRSEEETCTRNILNASPSTKLEKSFDYRLSPMTDRRWETLNIYNNDDNNHFNNPVKNIALSVKIHDRTKITLYEKAQPGVDDKLVIITIERNRRSSIKVCHKQADQCNGGSPQYFDPSSGEDEWLHIAIHVDFRSVVLWELNSPTSVVVNTGIFKSIRKIEVNGNAKWKIHDYNFISIIKTNRPVLITQHFGKNFENNRNKDIYELCLTVSVALCSKCNLKLSLEDDRVNLMKTTVYGEKLTDNGFMKWNTDVILRFKTNSVTSLYAYATHEGNSADGFWAIGNIKVCPKSEKRMLSLSTAEPHKYSCQSLKYPKWQLKWSDRVSEYCQYRDTSLIDANCAVPAACADDSGLCNKHSVCLPKTQTDSTCFCGFGYTNYPRCDTACPEGSYGYNCTGKCGKCKNRDQCDKITGECSSGCMLGYGPGKTCNELQYPRYRDPPKLVNEGPDYIKIRLDGELEGKILPRKIIIQVREESTWRDYFTKDYKKGLEAEIKDLSKLTQYEIRALLQPEGVDDAVEEDVPSILAQTTCQGITLSNTDIKPEKRQIKIVIKTTDLTCPINYYTLQIWKGGQKLKDSELSVPISIIGDLMPYTKYEIIIRNKNKEEVIFSSTSETNEDAPSEVKNLHNSTFFDTSITIAWDKPKEPNGVIREYNVTYQLVEYLGCKTETIRETPEISITTKELFKIMDLKPYSKYSITVAAKTVEYGNGSTIDVDTSQSDTIEVREIVDVTNTTVEAKSITFTWKPLECSERKGPLWYTFELECTEGEWCQSKKKEKGGLKVANAYNDRCEINVTPYTRYKLKITAQRQISDAYNKSINFNKVIRTLEGVPPPVRNLQEYMRDVTISSVRWLPPYPPHGEYENIEYKLKKCTSYSYSYTPTCESITVIPQPCKIWEKFICADVDHIQENSYVQIAAKNKNVYGISNVSPTNYERKTTRTVSDAPINLNHTWLNNKMTLYWVHPNWTHGVLRSFFITLDQIHTQIVSDIEKHYTTTILVSKDNYTYNYNHEVSLNIPYSTSYEVSVKAVTNHGEGNKATIEIDTPPETPLLEHFKSENLEVEVQSDSELILTIPAIQASTRTSESYIYIVVSNVTNNGENSSATDDILKLVYNYISNELKEEVPSELWIAGKFMPNTTRFTIGNEEFYDGKYLNKALKTKSCKYKIYTVLMNQYKTARSYSTYFLKDYQPSSSAGLYALFLLLLLLLPLTWVVYKKLWPKYKNYRSEIVETESIPITESVSNKKKANTHYETTEEHAAPLLSEIKGSKNTKQPIQSLNHNVCYSRPIKVEEFESYLRQALETNELEHQHKLFPRGATKPWEYGIKTQNKFKNRYANLAAYDDSRVKLRKLHGDPYSDYINACFIDGYKQTRTYIATQGPKVTTINDFWRMIWQENVKHIIMLANLTENEKKKCEKYWPEIEQTESYGQISVTYMRNDLYTDFEYRTFVIKNGADTRQVEQLHFTSWPDHGVPLYPQSLIPFLKKVHSISHENSPVVVHCSAGVGRTGTIILCDICIHMAKKEGEIDVLKYLHDIRNQRVNMVDNIDQYKLVHMVILEYLTAPDTSLSCINFQEILKKKSTDGTIQQQMKYLKQTKWQDERYGYVEEPNPENSHKNRNNSIVPTSAKIYISFDGSGDPHSNYINAVPVDGFCFKDQFIATQFPMPNTVKDFWTMIFERNVQVIVCLNEIPQDDKTCCEFWPTDNEMTTERDVTIKFINIELFENHNLIQLQLWNSKEESEKKFVRVIQYKDWPHNSKLPKTAEGLITLWDEVENISRGKHPIVITCYDGSTACGVYCAVSFMIEKIKMDQLLDACLAVRVIRRNRIQFVNNENQFKFLYKAADRYLAMFEEYSNFQVPEKNKY